MDLTSPSAFCAFAITVFASCARALPHTSAAPSATIENFLNTASPLTNCLGARENAPVLDILYRPGEEFACSESVLLLLALLLLQLLRDFLDFSPHAQEIAAPYFSDLFFGI